MNSKQMKRVAAQELGRMSKGEVIDLKRLHSVTMPLYGVSVLVPEGELHPCGTPITRMAHMLAEDGDVPSNLRTSLRLLYDPRPPLSETFCSISGIFWIHYTRIGEHAVINPQFNGPEPIIPANAPAGHVLGYTDPLCDAPSYVQKIAFWLDRALIHYRQAGFPNPTTRTSVIHIYVYSRSDRGVTGWGTIDLHNTMGEKLTAAQRDARIEHTCCHELFHMCQYIGLFDSAWHQVVTLNKGSLLWLEGTAELAPDFVNEWSNTWAEYWPVITPLLRNPLNADSLLDCSYEGCILWRYVCDRFSALSPAASGPLFGSDVMKEMLAMASPGATIDWATISHWMETHPAAIRTLPHVTPLNSLAQTIGNVAIPNTPAVLDHGRQLFHHSRYPALKGVGVYSDWLVANVVQGFANTAGLPFGYCDRQLAPDLELLTYNFSSEQQFGLTLQPLQARYCSFDVSGLGGAVRLKIAAKPLPGASTMEPNVQVVITDDNGVLNVLRDCSGEFDKEIRNGDYLSRLTLAPVAIRSVIVILSTGGNAGAEFSFALSRATS